MAGEVIPGGWPEQAGATGVGSGGGLEGRVASLEGRMGSVEIAVRSAAADAATAANNTAELLAIANATKSVAGFIRRHGPKAISFGCGVMTILGVGNPELWKYVGHFFGQ